MSRTSNPNDLSVRVRNRMEADRRQIEATTTSELRRLGENLRAVARDELRTTEADMAAATARTRLLLLNAWLRPLVVGPDHFRRDQRRELGADALAVGEHPGPHRDLGGARGTDRPSAGHPGRNRGHDVGRDAAGDRRRAVRGAAGTGRWTIRPGPWAGGLP